MIGVFLITIGTLFEELSFSVSKFAVRRRLEGINTIAVVNTFWSSIFFIIPLLTTPHERILVLSSAWLLMILVPLNVLQSYVTVHALARATRSTFGFFRTLTIPLVLVVDACLGYPLSVWQVVGILLITGTLLFLYKNHGINRRGLGLVLITALNAVVTLSMFKYLISHGNGVAMVGMLNNIPILLVMMLFAISHKERPFRVAHRPLVLGQSAALGVASILTSYAYLFLNASVAVALTRSIAVVWAIIVGRTAFHEKHLWIKVAGCVSLMIGMVCLAL